MSEETKKQFIGPKQVRVWEVVEDKTPGGKEIVKVEFEDDTVEFLAKIMFDVVVSDEACDETKLREKRVNPIVETLLSVLCEWGIKTGELTYMSALLNKSLDFNSNAALIKLVSVWMPKPNSLDDVDFVTIDRILKSDATDTK